jgi:predicted TIM-barrel fold metal-dependent hydrolase/tetratricopeptide (TPR) repeat protein
MVFSVYIGIVLGVIVAVCAAVLRRRSHRDRAEPRLTNKQLLTPESSPGPGDQPAREYTSIRNDIIPDGRIPGFDEPIFSFRLIILLLILALGGGGIFYWHYASYRLDTPQRSNDSHRLDTAQRPDSLQRPLPPRTAYTEVYSILGISPLPEEGENASIRRALEQLNRERCDKQAIFDLARAMQTGGYRREAAQVDVAFSRMCGGHAPSLRRAVNVLLALSDYVEAAAVASDLIDLEPLYDNGYYLRALARDGSGLAEKALDDYITAVELVGMRAAYVRLCPRFQQILYQQIHEEFGKPDLAPEEHDILRNMEPSEIDAMADELYARDDLLGRYIRWSLLYTRYRYELAEELDQLHGKIGQKSRVVLMTPAIVDFSKWLEDDDHSSIGDQVQVMARLARRKHGPRVHGFVGFCPLRQALYNDHRRRPGDKDPMSLVRAAIEGDGRASSGFIGVKLYPPMGFRAIGNKDLPDERFSEPGYLRTTETGLGSQIGRKLDAALSQLYAWCSTNNVPVMAHTSHSFGPNADYEDRADPAFWGDVLKQHAFPRLRINMAHFGHFNNAVAFSHPANYVDKCWEWTVGKIITGSAGGYAYADISSLGEILRVGASKKILECMRAFKERFPDSDERLLYGTDWSMIGQEDRFPKLFSPKPFPDIMVLFLRAVGYDDDQIDKIMFRNAARFLGLSKDEREKFGENSTRARLERFYAAHDLSTDWMMVFD